MQGSGIKFVLRAVDSVLGCSMPFRPEDCQRQAGAETRSKAESPEEKSIGIPNFHSESTLLATLFIFK